MTLGKEGRRFSQKLGLHAKVPNFFLQLDQPNTLRERQRFLIDRMLVTKSTNPVRQRSLMKIQILRYIHDRRRTINHTVNRTFSKFN